MNTAADPVDERLPFAKLLILGLQHVLVMYAGAVAVPLIVGGHQVDMVVAVDVEGHDTAQRIARPCGRGSPQTAVTAATAANGQRRRWSSGSVSEALSSAAATASW